MKDTLFITSNAKIRNELREIKLKVITEIDNENSENEKICLIFKIDDDGKERMKTYETLINHSIKNVKMYGELEKFKQILINNNAMYITLISN